MAGVLLLPFLKAGMLLAVSQLLGKVPEFSDWVNITCNTGTTYLLCTAFEEFFHQGQ